jgi:hypothetical protein
VHRRERFRSVRSSIGTAATGEVVGTSGAVPSLGTVVGDGMPGAEGDAGVEFARFPGAE